MIEKLKKIYNYGIKNSAYFRLLYKRITDDDIQVLASSLSYTTVLSLVPVMAVLLSAFSLFPGFESLKNAMLDFAVKNLMPNAGDIIKDYINDFVANASKTTIVGLLALFAISLLLIRRIDITLNKIWHTTSRRPRITTFAVYWTVLTLGPILLGISIAITSSIAAVSFFGEQSYFYGLDTYALSFIPSILTFIILTLVYLAVPVTKVTFLQACTGALVATVAQDMVRRLFMYFIVNFSSYALIYGALAAIPVIMVWVHVNWFVVLVGAEISATIKDFGESKTDDNKLITVN